MDIAIIHPELIYPRGAEKQVCMLSYYLSKFGHEVTLYTFEKKDPYIYDSLLENVEIHSLNKKWVLGNPLLDTPRWLLLLKKISKEIKNKPHDIINTHNPPSQWMSTYTKKAVVWSCNEPYLYYSLDKNYIIRTMSSILISIDKYLSKNIRIILCLDPMMERIIKNRYPNIKTLVTWSGVDLDKKVEHIVNDYLDVIFVGPIHPQKRPLDVIRALTIIKNENKFQRIKLHLVGEILSWALKREIEQLGSQFNIEIQFYGYVSNEKLLNLYSMADLAVFVPEMQPWGIFPLEAILAGIPTIISDQCGIKFILPDDFPVVRTGNVSQLADKILEIIDKYEIYKRLVNKISKDLSENYSWEKYSKRLETIFKAILDKNDNNIKF